MVEPECVNALITQYPRNTTGRIVSHLPICTQTYARESACDLSQRTEREGALLLRLSACHTALNRINAHARGCVAFAHDERLLQTARAGAVAHLVLRRKSDSSRMEFAARSALWPAEKETVGAWTGGVSCRYAQ